MCRRAHEPALGKWVTPSGYLECGETLQEAAARETFEEAGVRLDPARMELYAIVNAPDIDQVRVLFRIDLLQEPAVKPGPESLEASFMSEEQIRAIDLAWPASSRRATQVLFAQHRAGNFDIHLMSVGAQHPNGLNARSYPIAQSAPKRGTSPDTGDGG
jgi:ADP-ribose pyrophosphatase YjhB (NUDIX family)